MNQASCLLSVVGLGPGAPELMTPAARHALDSAEDIVGYTTYVRLAGALRPEQRVHASDNRQELERARTALDLAASGRRVVVVSSGDPGIFAMASAVLEVLDQEANPAWDAVSLDIVPGLTAAQVVASRVGAPLGHDFCVLSLSDNLKPWALIERRIEYAIAADLVLALYNPGSQARPWQIKRALELLLQLRAPTTPVVLGRDVGRVDETTQIVTLAEVNPEQIDMRTTLIIGSSQTRRFTRADGEAWVYTPRCYPDLTADA